MTRWLSILLVILATSTVTHAQVCCDNMNSGQQQQQSFGFQQSQQPGLIPMPNGGALFGPITPNAYGPGLNMDATGRPFRWQPEGGGTGFPDPTLQVNPNAYGPGIGMDQYGRPVSPACPPGWAGPC